MNLFDHFNNLLNKFSFSHFYTNHIYKRFNIYTDIEVNILIIHIFPDSWQSECTQEKFFLHNGILLLQN